MRVISGRAKGRRLQSPRGLGTRPTSDRIKENLFNILGPQIPGSRFLDLFAGCGGIGIEAKSRGAAAVVLVEKHPSALCCLKKNLLHTALDGEVLADDVFSALGRLDKQKRQFELIFLDPPYGRELVNKTLARLEQTALLAPGGLIIAEYGRKEDIAKELLKLVAVREVHYGDTCLGFFACKEEAP